MAKAREGALRTHTSLGKIDTVRASRDGHTYHDTWTARLSLRLLTSPELFALAVEGLSPVDDANLKPGTSEIADLALYYGQSASLPKCDRLEVLQFKFSHRNETKLYTAADAKQTLQKFFARYQDLRESYGTKAVYNKVSFAIVTNRPICPAFLKALTAIVKGIKPRAKEIVKQVRQIENAFTSLNEDVLSFLSRVNVHGTAGGFSENLHSLAHTIADWSPADAVYRDARLGALRELVRSKAGYQGQGRNLIKLVNVLGALGISQISDLLPCPASLPATSNVIQREQLLQLRTEVMRATKPLLIHATGGVGKTVFLQLLAKAVHKDGEVVFFDCFAQGLYRSPDDYRHRPSRGLLHILNELASKGLCDPVLPDGIDEPRLFETARRRIEQAVQTIRRSAPSRFLLLIIDAADNAGQLADDLREASFPRQLLESLHWHDMPDGLKVVVSGRSERLSLITDNLQSYVPFELKPFTKQETELFIKATSGHSGARVDWFHTRSDGNPRVLSHLLQLYRNTSVPKAKTRIELDKLIDLQIHKALQSAGIRSDEPKLLLTGLASFPPPVPVDDLASAAGVTPAAVLSFVSDLSGLIEHIPIGLVFRDEPTETFIRQQFGAEEDLLRRLSRELRKLQVRSVYAARTLPHLLVRIEDENRLYDLAFSNEFPERIKSEVSRRQIRESRLRAALSLALTRSNYTELVAILFELSSVTMADSRGREYLLENCDLVGRLGDDDGLRRITESRTKWPGERHSRLSVVHALRGEKGESWYHANWASSWITWLLSQEKEDFNRHRLETDDLVAPALHLLVFDDFDTFWREIARWNTPYSFSIAVRALELVLGGQERAQRNSTERRLIDSFVRSTSKGAPALLALLRCSKVAPVRQTKILIAELSKLSIQREEPSLAPDRNYFYDYSGSVLFAAGRAVAVGLSRNARALLKAVPQASPSRWAFTDNWDFSKASYWMACCAVRSAATGRTLQVLDLIPAEWRSLLPAGTSWDDSHTIERLRSALQEIRSGKQNAEEKIGRDQAYWELRALNERLVPLMPFLIRLVDCLHSGTGTSRTGLSRLIREWNRFSQNQGTEDWASRFINSVCRNLSLFAAEVTQAWSKSTVTNFIELAQRSPGFMPHLERLLAMLQTFPSLHEIAGLLAGSISEIIDKEAEIVSRTNSYAELSRLTYGISIEDSELFFHQGLKDLELLGSADQDYTLSLLSYLSGIRGGSLSDKQLHHLNSLCEVLVENDPRKFPWDRYGLAAASIGETRAFGQLLRWDQRSLIELEHSLPPLVIALLSHGHLKPDSALVALSLCNPTRTGQWDFGHIFKAFPSDAFRGGPNLAQEFLNLMEERCGEYADPVVLEFICSELAKALPPSSTALRRLDDFVELQRSKRRSGSGPSDSYLSAEERKARQRKERRAIAKAQKIGATQFWDVQSIERALLRLTNRTRGVESAFFASARARVPHRRRVEFLRQVSSLKGLDFHGTCAQLIAAIEEWKKSSKAICGIRHEIAETVLRLHSREILSAEWGIGYRVQELARLGAVEESVIILGLLREISRAAIEVPGAVWLELANRLLPLVPADAAITPSAKFLDSASSKIAEVTQDGQWNPLLKFADQEEVSVAALVWYRLGSPNAVDRWRAAHAVRKLAKFGRWEIVSEMAALFNAPNAPAYLAEEPPFFSLHAHLWYLIALARLAHDWPAEIWKLRPLLEQTVGDERSSHVLMRQFAADALATCLRLLQLTDTSLQPRLDRINRSPFEEIKKRNRSYTAREPLTRSRSQKRPSFYFDYDFQKYEIANLCNVFEAPQWQVEDRIRSFVRNFAPTASSMYDTGRKDRQFSHSDYSHRDEEQVYGAYLAWHGLMCAAGELLSDRPTYESFSWDDAQPSWENWLSPFLLTWQDGTWLSDGTDPFPVELYCPIRAESSSSEILIIESRLLAALGFSGKKASAKVCVDASFQSPDGVRISLTSAFVDEEAGDRLAEQLAKAERHDIWLPRVSADEARDPGRIDEAHRHFVPWLIHPDCPTQLDGYDRAGSRYAAERVYPAHQIVSEMEIHKADQFGRSWVNKEGAAVFQIETWASNDGERDGIRTLCDTRALMSLLARRKSKLICLLTLVHYGKSLNYDQPENAFTGLVLTISRDSLVKRFPLTTVEQQNRRTGKTQEQA